MKIRFLKVFILLLIDATACIAQSVKVNLQPQITINNTQYIKLYKKEHNSHDCLDNKTGGILDKDKLSPCFKYIKTFKRNETEKLITIIRSRDSYNLQTSDCFASDYALLLFNKKNEVISQFVFSLICNRFYSNTIPPELKEHAKGNLSLVGLTADAKKEIIKTFGLKSSVYTPM